MTYEEDYIRELHREWNREDYDRDFSREQMEMDLKLQRDFLDITKITREIENKKSQLSGQYQAAADADAKSNALRFFQQELSVHLNSLEQLRQQAGNDIEGLTSFPDWLRRFLVFQFNGLSLPGDAAPLTRFRSLLESVIEKWKCPGADEVRKQLFLLHLSNESIKSTRALIESIQRGQ